MEYESGEPLNKTIGRLSLSGAQPKIALHLSEAGQWYLPSPSHLSTHILKPNPIRFSGLGIVERQTMLAAAFLGLKVADSEIRIFGGTSAYVTRRFDRYTDGINLFRKHQEDFCQALSLNPEKNMV